MSGSQEYERVKYYVMISVLSALLVLSGTANADEGVDASDEVTTEAVTDDAESPAVGSEFRFGSYGRARAATDLRGNSARPVNIVSFGSRVDERSYGELEFQQRFFRPDDDPDFESNIVATLAFLDDFFHYTGDFDHSIALRNLYATVGWRADAVDVDLWGGSRMYRGDDIYLLDFWPLDNLNTVGGGAQVRFDSPPGPTDIRVHAGVNRLHNPYQYQAVEVPGLEFGTDEVVLLDRQRFVVSGRVEQQLWLKEGGARGLKGVLYGETQHLPEGVRRLDDGVTEEALPGDGGWLVGGQLGFWEAEGFLDGSFANLFVRYASGLAAYGELGVPFGVAADETATGATDLLAGLSGTIDTPYAGLVLGSYFRNFRTARIADTHEDYWETIVASRLHGYLTDHIHPGVEVSYQVRRQLGPYPESGDYERAQLQAPSVTKVSVIQAFSLEPRAFSRPQLRLLYTASFLNDSARMLYRPEDPRRDFDTQHYLGIMVEWWFNSASY